VSRPFDTITIEQVARYPRPGTTVPARVSFTPGNTAITYLFSAEGTLIRSLWRYDIATGARSVLAGPPAAAGDGSKLSREEELRRERARLRELGVTGYEFAPRAEKPVLLVTAGGPLFVSREGSEPTPLPGRDGAVDPHLSDDGRAIAFVRDGDLFALELDGAGPRRLTHTAGDSFTNGLAEFIAAEELDRDRGFWWSPDGTRIAYIEADSRHIPEYPIVHQGLDSVEVERHRYPFAGAANARLRLGLVTVASGETEWLDTGPDEDQYIARVAWTPGNVLTAQLLTRDQKTIRLVAFEGSKQRLLIEEHTEPWVNLSHCTRFLESGEILWSSERSGFRHLYLCDSGGQVLRQLTEGDWVVTRLVGVDEKRRLVYFVATRETPVERHVYRAPLDGGAVERLTSEPGWHDAVLSTDGERWVDTWNSLAHGPRVALRKADGTLEAMLFANEGATAEELGLDPPEIVTLPAGDGTTLYGALYRPRPPSHGTKPPDKAPAVVSVYGGPHAQMVANEWSLTVGLRAQYLASQGFVVFVLDNRGSANRGLAFEAHLHLRLGSVEVEDQAAGVRWLSRLPFVDGERVGVYGWSYGGFMALMCLMREPGLFKVGVAGAPVAHWAGYDTGYTERYMSTPALNPEGYRDGSPLSHVESLVGKLFITHGMVDENVHFRHTARLMVALGKAQKEYESLIYPEERHMPRDARGMEYMERRVTGFFEKHL